MTDWKSPLTDNDLAAMQEIADRCRQRAPVIEALDSLGIDVRGLDQQNRAQEQFCLGCIKAKMEGRL